jgi:CDP-paratose 2-epimerase
MKYLIVGGAGFIGTNFADSLLTRQDEVIIFDNYSRVGSLENILYLKNKYSKVQFIQGDIRVDFHKLTELAEKVDFVFHLAGQVAVTTSVYNPREDFEINALGTFNVLEAIRISKRRPTMLYASTNKVYGGMEDLAVIEGDDQFVYEDLEHGVNESWPLDFHSPYGCSKGAGDQYVRDYSRIYGLNTVVLRQSCIYGPRQFGVEDQGWVAWFAIAAIINKKITIFGTGKQVRDILFVGDLFNAWDLASKNINSTNGKIYNIGGGIRNTISLINLIEYLEKILDKKINFSYDSERPGDQPVFISDIRLSAHDFNWAPNVDVNSGIHILVNWISDNRKLFSNIK